MPIPRPTPLTATETGFDPVPRILELPLGRQMLVQCTPGSRLQVLQGTVHLQFAGTNSAITDAIVQQTVCAGHWLTTDQASMSCWIRLNNQGQESAQVLWAQAEETSLTTLRRAGGVVQRWAARLAGHIKPSAGQAPSIPRTQEGTQRA